MVCARHHNERIKSVRTFEMGIWYVRLLYFLFYFSNEIHNSALCMNVESGCAASSTHQLEHDTQFDNDDQRTFLFYFLTVRCSVKHIYSLFRVTHSHFIHYLFAMFYILFYTFVVIRISFGRCSHCSPVSFVLVRFFCSFSFWIG